MTARPARHLVIGNPENRRVTAFVAALRRRGHPEPVVLGHLDLLRRPEALDRVPQEPYFVRIDSAGENVEVENELLQLGWADARELGVTTIGLTEIEEPRERGRITCPRQFHLGFIRHMRWLESALLRRFPDAHFLTDTESVLELFDKRVTGRRWAALGVPVPPAIDEAVASPDELREQMRARGFSSVFVKLSCASSASCLGVYRLPESGPSVLMTTMRPIGTELFNSLRVQRIDDPVTIDRLLRFLLGEGARIERSMPKARLGGAFFDLRVLVIAGEPEFVVVRQSAHPITNLHLGGWRGDLDVLRAVVPEVSWAAAMASCRTVFASQRSLHVGVDLGFAPKLDSHFVFEGNAFGDLLPGLEHDGLDVYETEIERATASQRGSRR